MLLLQKKNHAEDAKLKRKVFDKLIFARFAIYLESFAWTYFIFFYHQFT